MNNFGVWKGIVDCVRLEIQLSYEGLLSKVAGEDHEASSMGCLSLQQYGHSGPKVILTRDGRTDGRTGIMGLRELDCNVGQGVTWCRMICRAPSDVMSYRIILWSD